MLLFVLRVFWVKITIYIVISNPCSKKNKGKYRIKLKNKFLIQIVFDFRMIFLYFLFRIQQMLQNLVKIRRYLWNWLTLLLFGELAVLKTIKAYKVAEFKKRNKWRLSQMNDLLFWNHEEVFNVVTTAIRESLFREKV